MISRSAHPVQSRDHVAVLEFRADKLERKLKSALGRIFAAQRALLNAAPTFEDVTPKRLPLAVRRAQILAKRDEVVNQARQAFIRAAYPEITALSANGFQGLHCLTVTRIAEAAEVDKKTTIADEVVDFLAADIKTKAERAAKRTHAALLAAPRRKKMKTFTDEDLEEIKTRLSAEVNEWKKTSAAAGKALKKQTLDHVALYELRQKRHATRKWVSAVEVERHEQKLFADIEAMRVRSVSSPKPNRCKSDRICSKAKCVSALARVLKDEVLAASVVEKIDSHFHKAPFQILQAHKRQMVEQRMIAEKHDRAPYGVRSVNDILLGSV